MIGKVYEIGFTKRKRIPILIRDRNEEWSDIFIINYFLFDQLMRKYPHEELDHNILFMKSTNTDFAGYYFNDISTHYYPNKQIINTHQPFIPVKRLSKYDLMFPDIQDWEFSSINSKPQTT